MYGIHASKSPAVKHLILLAATTQIPVNISRSRNTSAYSTANSVLSTKIWILPANGSTLHIRLIKTLIPT